MSQETYLKSLSPKDRINHLNDNAMKTDSGNYMKALTEDEIIAAKDKNINNAIQLGDHQEKLDEIKKEYKEKMEPLQIENKILLTEIRTKQKKVNGTLWHVPNFDDRMMESYNEDGELIATRRLLPTEQNGILSHMSKVVNE